MAKLQIGIGFHAGEPCYCNGIGDYLDTLSNAGVIIAAKSVDGSASLHDFSRNINNGASGYGVHRILRGYDVPAYGSDINSEVERYMLKLHQYWPPELNKNHFYVEMINECDKNQSDWLGHFCCALAERMMAEGFKFCSPGWSTGEPEKNHWETEGMLKWLRMVSENEGKLAIAVHEYAFNNEMISTVPWNMGRVSLMNEVCFEHGIDYPDVLITEWGWSYNQAPGYHSGIPQIVDQIKWYLLNTPNVKAVYLWALDKGSHWGSTLPAVINAYMEPLTDTILNTNWPEPADKDVPQPETKPKIVIVKLSQDHGPDAWSAVAAYAYTNYKRTMTASHDDMLSMLRSGNTKSYAVIVDPERESQKFAIRLLNEEGFKYQVLYVDDKPNVPVADLFEYRPCDTERITQLFGANPEYYAKFGLPGHDGVDFGVEAGGAYYAVQDGEVVHASNMRPSGGESAWGWHVILMHNVEGFIFHTVYAHAAENLPVSKGQYVKAGNVVGISGNTGISNGYHLHFSLLFKNDPGNGYPKWTYGYPVDPYPYLAGRDRPPKPGAYDMLNYVRGSNSLNGVLYEVKNSNGGQERFQVQIANADEFWQTKDWKVEQFKYTNNHIYRGFDTSPGDNRWYQLQDPKGSDCAAWIPRHWSIGQRFSNGLWVQFFDWNCNLDPQNSGNVFDTFAFVAHHNSWTSRAGITLNDVVEIEWVNGGERYFYARGYGLVAWERSHYDPNTPSWSAISEIHEPGQRPHNVVVLPPCMLV